MPRIPHLILDQPGTFLARHQGRLRVVESKTGKVLQEAPLLFLEAVVIASRGVGLSAAAVEACAQEGIPIHFVRGEGAPYAALYTSRLTGTVRTRRAQLAAYGDRRGAQAARAFALGKLRSQAGYLRYLARTTGTAELADLADAVADLALQVEGVDAPTADAARLRLLNLEGRGAESYWAGLARVLPAELEFPGRTGRGARDPFNAMLNYGYGVLYGQVERALLLAGLDPYAGFLHADRPGKPSLVLDLIEEFRVVAVDQVLVGWVRRGGRVQMEEGLLDRPSRKGVAERVLARLREGRMPYEGKRLSLGGILQAQARRLATFLRGERPAYEPFVPRW